MKRLITRKQLSEDMRLPRGYAVAYMDVATLTYTAYPIPLHWVVRWLNNLSWDVICHWKPNCWERTLHIVREDGYKAGYEAGYKNGTRESLMQLVEQMKRNESHKI